MNPLKVFVKDDDSAVIKCPFCRSVRTVSAAKFKELNKVLKVKCVCKQIFGVKFEFRKMYRKDTNLSGSYVSLSTATDGGNITVKNVSMDGIGFVPLFQHNTEANDTIEVTFTLDNNDATVIEKKAIVKMSTANYIGCEFVEKDVYNKALGFFLMP